MLFLSTFSKKTIAMSMLTLKANCNVPWIIVYYCDIHIEHVSLHC